MRGLVGAVFGVLAMEAVGVIAAVAPTFNGCVGGCDATTRPGPKGNKFFGCSSADDLGCLCKKNDFLFGVRDCSRACGAPNDMIQNWVKAGPCAPFNAVLPGDGPAPSSTQAQPKTSSSAPPPPPTTSSSSVSVASTPTATTTTQSSSSAAASATGASTEAASTTATEATASSTAPATESTSAAAAAGGLSYASTVGIGVGVAAAVVAAGIVGFILLKNRKRKPAPRQSMDISKPLPGSGRTYPQRERVRDSFEKYAADIEMTSNRYEDMVPSTKPRTMV